MKTTFVILLGLMLYSPLSGRVTFPPDSTYHYTPKVTIPIYDSGSVDAVYRMRGHTVEYDCEICGVEVNEFIEDGSLPWLQLNAKQYANSIIYTKEKIGNFTFPEHQICLPCEKKYGEELNLLITKFIDKKKADNKSVRAKHAAEKAARKKQELQKRVEELKRELKELEEEP